MQLWWAFGPGSVNLVGDFLSRNHANRDEMFGLSEEDAEAKSATTLKQVLGMVQVRQCARDIAM